ncbi:homeobox domain-containing protein [Cokeromyces recurvatus]|uniref:homeobox domain-containing protein n=1 Tax=Cokeromyces recurvatus TaxID=90255 RepID=UPI00221F5DBD|nr:homeobox domain-containing protein [Cokeromyces recurvatus]KAI7900024.1 homeobox domain-containing protein [Cokeromyces recurvatus]
MATITVPNTQQRQSSEDSKKRTRVTPSQLTILEETFTISSTPDSKMRKQLSYRLQMPERSIQIWFQNRRAKVKMLQKRALLRQEQEATRARLCAQVNSPYGYPYWYLQQQHCIPQKLPAHRAWSTDLVVGPTNQFIPPPPHPPPHPPFSQLLQYDSPSNHEDIYSLTISPSPTPQSFTAPRRLESEPLHNTTTTTLPSGVITATSVTIGSWHRMKISQQDLMCYYKLNERSFSWHIRDSNYHFKMMMSFDSITSIELNVLEDHISAQIDIDLIEPPIFFMEKENANWIQCSDFTEGIQASVVLRHTIRGLASDLRQELLGIASTDERLCQLTRFPAAIDLLMTPSIDQALLINQQQNWRHQSVPISSSSPITKDCWIPPSYPN